MRKPTITRTIKTKMINVLALDVNTCEVENRTFPLYESEIPKDEKKLLDYVRKMYETENFKISAIVNSEIVERTYSMPLSKFIELSEIAEIEKTEKTEN